MSESSPPGATPTNTRPPVSLLICSRNRSQLLFETIESVLQGDDVPDEILIVDQSTNKDERLATLTSSRDCTIRYIWSQTTGLSRSRNISIREAAHDALVVIDDDMFVEKNWFTTISEALFEGGPDVVITGRVMAARQATSEGFVPSLRTDPQPRVYKGRTVANVLSGGHMAAFRQTLQAIGGFDERLGAGSTYPAADDIDVGYRLLDAGYTIRYLPEAIIYHRAWRTPQDLVKLDWAYAYGQGGYYAKHLSFRNLGTLKRFFIDIKNHAIGMFKIRGRRYEAKGDAYYIVELIIGMSRWMIQERLLPRLRRRPGA